ATLIEPTMPHLHTNFKLNAAGEALILSDNAGATIDEIDLPALSTDVSYGRQPDGSDDWFMFDEATPDSSNTTTGFTGMATEPVFDLDSGFYTNSATFGFLDIPADETIYYTLDGSLPDETYYPYSTSVTVDSIVVVRARAFADGKIPSNTITRTYFIDLEPTLPVISLVSDPYNLFDEDYGIYALGPNASSTYPYFGANFWEDWERPINIQMFESDGTEAFQVDAGVKIFGNYSRGHDQKSLAIYCRDQYGYNSINYQIFEDKDIDEFNNIILRNSGNDWEWSMMRDGLMTSVLKDTGLDRQAYRPASIYINGEYWGILNIREKINEHFIEENHGVDPDNLQLLEDDASIIQGENDHYLALLDFLENNDMTLPENYDYICTQMDMENYLNYMVAELFYCNEDWPGRNIKFWRENTEDSKWKWIIFDLDFGLGYWGGADTDMFEFALNPNGPSYPNPPWSTFLFRSLVVNDQFVHDMSNLFADYMNSIFDPTWFNAELLELHDYLEPEMENHVVRWNNTMASWENEMLVMQWFMNDRPDYVKTHIMDHFGFPGTANIYLDISPTGSGSVQVNTLEVDEFPWVGEYFQNNPVTLTGLNSPGWQFVGWSGDVISDSTSITLAMEDEYSLIAWFEPAVSYVDSIVFNEINYNSSANFDPEDWVEIYNRSEYDIDMSGWYFSDSDDEHQMFFPAAFVLPSQSYYVLCRDTVAFAACFPNVENRIGAFDFGLSSSGEMIRLFTANAELIDYVEYGATSPWPTEPNGNGPTLALCNPGWDNTQAESWAASADHGTPGEINDVYVSTDPNLVVQAELQLLQNYPNPFNPSTSISYSLPADSRVKLAIYNIKGQLVQVLVDDFREQGRYTAVWQGDNQSGKAVASGIYLYKLSNGKMNKSKKMMLLK
ncbi:MAG TPA: CotH kinase family protein, partial [Candidatus Cloacimonadota bacterium]|nr:CotH kinase family protein [Candidatus Cloacimonadota bacterium]